LSNALVPSRPGEYAVARPRGVCSVSHEPIAPDEPFMAALRETPAGFERLDVKLAHWPAFDRADVVAHWRAVMPRPDAKRKPKLLVDDDALCDLLARLADVTEPAKLSFRFVLALILMRKRRVTYESTRHEGGVEVWRMRFRGRGDAEPFDVVDPKPTDEQIAQVHEQLGQILNDA